MAKITDIMIIILFLLYLSTKIAPKYVIAVIPNNSKAYFGFHWIYNAYDMIINNALLNLLYIEFFRPVINQ